MRDPKPKILYLIVRGMIPPGTIYGVFDSEEKAKEAIKTNDKFNSSNCYIEELTLNEWIQYGMDV